MKILKIIIILTAIYFNSVKAGAKDDPLLTHIKVDKLSYFQHDGADTFALEADFWLGKDLNKFWLKTEVKQEGSETEKFELQALYSKAVSAYWDMQLGVRHDFNLPEERTWAVIGLQGLAPYYFEIDSALFIGDNGDLAARFSAEYEMMLTQQWILSPEIELDFYGQNDLINRVGSGLSSAHISLRLKYEFIREFTFYAGIEHEKQFGKTAELTLENNGETKVTNTIIGISFWF